TVTNDPRSPAANSAIHSQHELLRKFNAAAKVAYDGYQEVEAMRAQLTGAAPVDSTSAAAKALRDLRAKVDTVGGNARIGGRRPPPNFYALNATAIGHITAQDNGDHAPTEAALAAYTQVCRDLQTAVARWETISTKDAAALNIAPQAHSRLNAPDCGGTAGARVKKR